MKMGAILVISLMVITTIAPSVSAWWIFSEDLNMNDTFDEEELRKYLPIFTNDILPETVYAKMFTSSVGSVYAYMCYWDGQEGFYKLASHDYDWEFIVVYVHPNGQPYQVNYDAYHYNIGRHKYPDVHNETHVLMYVNPEYHYFVPDIGMRHGNLEEQLNVTIEKCTYKILKIAQEQVSFDPELFDDPYVWQEGGFWARRTAFDTWWKAFWAVSDKKSDWINLEDPENWFAKWFT